MGEFEPRAAKERQIVAVRAAELRPRPRRVSGVSVRATLEVRRGHSDCSAIPLDDLPQRGGPRECEEASRAKHSRALAEDPIEVWHEADGLHAEGHVEALRGVAREIGGARDVEVHVDARFGRVPSRAFDHGSAEVGAGGASGAERSLHVDDRFALPAGEFQDVLAPNFAEDAKLRFRGHARTPLDVTGKGAVVPSSVGPRVAVPMVAIRAFVAGEARHAAR